MSPEKDLNLAATVSKNILNLRIKYFGNWGGQARFAKSIGLPQSTIKANEAGDNIPTEDRLRKLAEFFGVTVAQLRGDIPLDVDALPAQLPHQRGELSPGKTNCPAAPNRSQVNSQLLPGRAQADNAPAPAAQEARDGSDHFPATSKMVVGRPARRAPGRRADDNDGNLLATDGEEIYGEARGFSEPCGQLTSAQRRNVSELVVLLRLISNLMQLNLESPEFAEEIASGDELPLKDICAELTLLIQSFRSPS